MTPPTATILPRVTKFYKNNFIIKSQNVSKRKQLSYSRPIVRGSLSRLEVIDNLFVLFCLIQKTLRSFIQSLLIAPLQRNKMDQAATTLIMSTILEKRRTQQTGPEILFNVSKAIKIRIQVLDLILLIRRFKE